MSTYSRPYAIWRWFMVMLGLAACIASLFWWRPGMLVGVGLLTMALSLTEVIPIDMPGRAISLTPGVEIAAAMILGPTAAIASVVGCAVGGLVQESLGQKREQAPEFAVRAAPSAVSTFVAGLVSVSYMPGARGAEIVLLLLYSGTLYLLVKGHLIAFSDTLRYNVSYFRNLLNVTPGMLGLWAIHLLTALAAYHIYSLLGLTWFAFFGHAVFSALVMYAARLYFSMRATYWSTIMVLILAIESELKFGEGHSVRVATYSLAMARKMLLTHSEAFGVVLGALFHDVGMIGIDDRIVNKPSGLTSEEFAIVMTHAEIGAKIVSKVPFLTPASEIVMHHHERFDGNGYPSRLRGEEIPLGARIVAAADAFDALCSRRPYRSALGLQDALVEIRRSQGTQFDPRVVQALGQVIEDEIRWGKDAFAQHYSIDTVR